MPSPIQKLTVLFATCAEKQARSFGTSAMINHLHCKHQSEYKQYVYISSNFLLLITQYSDSGKNRLNTRYSVLGNELTSVHPSSQPYETKTQLYCIHSRLNATDNRTIDLNITCITSDGSDVSLFGIADISAFISTILISFDGIISDN